ncbi:MAG: ankyrin repeat domain-containing protein [Planctomycetia bacterium]|nr:ankyrin repeat domain-containing protein [Planctomycetia bacterium]
MTNKTPRCTGMPLHRVFASEIKRWAGLKREKTSMIDHCSTSVAVVAILVTCSLLCRAQEIDGQRLLDAAKNGQVSTVQSLLDQGVSPKAKDESGRTPLHLSAANGHQATAEALWRSGADINALDDSGKTPLDLAETGGHSRLAAFFLSKGGKRTQALATSGPGSVRMLKPSLKFKTVEEFEREVGEPAVLLDSANVCFFVPKRREKEAQIVLGYLVKAYDALYQTVGTHTDYKIAVYAFPKGNPHGWGGTSECSIEYDDSNLALARQPEWIRYKVPHVSGYIEEMAHNFVSATKAQFGWEMIGWSLGAEVSQQLAGNPILAADLRATREEQKRTFTEYVRNGYIVPKDLPPNLCDRIHAWLLCQAASKYGPRFWTDFFREVRSQRQALSDAVRLGDGDKIRNARYQITIACFDRLPGLDFRNTLRASGVSLTTDVKSLHPDSPDWNRRLAE